MGNPEDKEENKGKINVPNSVVRKVKDNGSRVRRNRRGGGTGGSGFGEFRRRWKPRGHRLRRSFVMKQERLDEKDEGSVGDHRTVTSSNLRMHVLGQPAAPYNTTQFLMDDHHVRDPESEHIEERLQVNPATVSNLPFSANANQSDVTNNNEEEDDNNNNNNGNKDKTHLEKQKTLTLTPDYIGVGYRRRCMSDSTPTSRDLDDIPSDDLYSSPDEELDFIQRQFFEAYENIHAERISTMSKAELVKEYLLLEQRCESLESKLKEMECNVRLET